MPEIPQEAAAHEPPCRRLFYDASCGLCRALRDWLAARPQRIVLDFVPLDDPRAERLLPDIPPAALRREMHALAEDGRLHVGIDAWILALDATRDFAFLARWLSRPPLHALASRLAPRLASRRYGLSRLFCHGHCAASGNRPDGSDRSC